MNGDRDAPYRSLEVYKKAYQVALQVHKKTLNFPKIEQFELAAQLRRSSRSIVANLIEGMGRQDSPAEVQRFVRIAMGSCDESRVWLDFAQDLGYLSEAEKAELERQFVEVGKMLRGVLNRYQAIKESRASSPVTHQK